MSPKALLRPIFRRWSFALPLLWASVAVFLRWHVGPWPIDDAYITFRYVAHGVQGHGLVYNPGERILGVSTPLWMLVLTGLCKHVVCDIPLLAARVNAVLDGVSVLLLYALARRFRLSPWAASVPALFWAFYPLSLKYAAGGMETALATLLLLAMFNLYLRRQEHWAAFMAGGALLARPDALAAVGPMFFAMLRSTPRRAWTKGLVLGAVLLPWWWFSWHYYGQWLPQSLVAKSAPIYRASPGENFWQGLYLFNGLLLSGPLGWTAHGFYIFQPLIMRLPLIPMALGLVALWFLGFQHARRQDGRWSVVLGFPWLFLGTYVLLGLRGNLAAEWYFVPLAPFLALGLWFGWVVYAKTRAPTAARRWLLVFGGSALLLAQVAGLNWGRHAERPFWFPRSIWVERETMYRQIASHLRQNLQPGETVAAPEIGTIGYFCLSCRVLDTVGLVSPQALRYYPLPPDLYVTIYAVPPDLIRDARPQYLVGLDVFWRRSLFEQPWFQEEYTLVMEEPTTIFGSTALQVFVRRETTALPSSHPAEAP